MYSSNHDIRIRYKMDGIINTMHFSPVDIYFLSTFITGISSQGATEIVINIADPEPEEFTKENIK